ncbi:LAGLIDADG family homing endonuclease [Streptomyces triculaminicus]|uniref:LAGLIDADG family homing endonuclease n=1 Tax=Streptomyces triculaminicus TaxID=2816232 RepID=UPI0033DCBF81
MTFMDLEDPRYAYMFGFLQADGHLSAGTGQKGHLTVEISYRDIDILHAFQELCPYYSSIRERTRATNFAESHRSAIWTLCALEARNRLAELGIPYGKKSRRITPPRVPFSKRDYLRGVIDADGAVGLTAQGLPFVSLSTTSTAIATYLCRYTKLALGIPKTTSRNARDRAYNIMYMRELGVAVADHLYYPGSLALERKRSTAAEVSAWIRPAHMSPPRPRRSWTQLEDRLLLDAPTIAEAAEKLGRSEQSCNLRRWRLRKKHQTQGE